MQSIKVPLFLLFILCAVHSTEANPPSDSLLIKISSIKILSHNFDRNRIQLFELISTANAGVKTLVEEKLPDNNARHLKITLQVDNAGLQLLQDHVETFGYVDRKSQETIDNGDEIRKLAAEIKFLEKRLDAYQKEFELTEKSLTSESRNCHWQKIRKLEEDLFHVRTEMNDKLQEVRENTYEIEMTEEIYTPQSAAEKGIQFVNMPGVAYSSLKIENPLDGFSGKSYTGYEIKYMFTRGKSYFQFGALKADDEITADSQISELFMYGFGQDFYPRYFGRGKRAYLNLYTGYTIGGFFAATKDKSRHKFQLMANFGLEIYKSNYVLLDSRLGYFIPFYENRNLRGMLGSLSFNFVF